MTNPDLIYMMHEHRYQKLLAEAERVRAQRAVANGQATRSGGWPLTWLRDLVVRRLRGVAVTQ